MLRVSQFTSVLLQVLASYFPFSLFSRFNPNCWFSLLSVNFGASASTWNGVLDHDFFATDKQTGMLMLIISRKKA